jgi:hypothetical protein
MRYHDIVSEWFCNNKCPAEEKYMSLANEPEVSS